MPSTSKAMRRLMGLAEHHPEQVRPENRGVLKMTHQQLHDFAATPEKGLPARASSGQHPHRNLGKYLHPKKR